ncbi:tRNA-specific adenosine deaminase 1 isoform X2 [Amia ocellicauda]|uniref:tRNA-specific adenosine deaminase 1 isoform X2 n=1 Tax=Amia ocellicauda TaxID=2972642 RepID=UPI003463F1E2
MAPLSCIGNILNDSHAEVVARRGFIRYLTEQLRGALKGQDSGIFSPGTERSRWRLRPGVSFIFFTSHTPCGDASIIPMVASQDQPCQPIRAPSDITDHLTKGKSGVEASPSKRKAEENGEPVKRLKTCPLDCAVVGEGGSVLGEEGSDPPHGSSTGSGPGSSETAPDSKGPDVHRTGAKCVPTAKQDPLRPGEGYHCVGVLRVKPGRGDRTLSLCCSDKLARWNVVGCQGALLSHFLQEPIYFSAVVTGECPYSQEAMKRALMDRCAHVTDLPPGYSVRAPELRHASLEFPHSHRLVQGTHDSSKGRVTPCGAAISWCAVPDQPLDVTANGYKQGVTKKALGTAQARSLICKAELFSSFKSLVVSALELPDSLRGKELKTYWDYKQAAEGYQKAWEKLREQAFSEWVRSPRELLQFE